MRASLTFAVSAWLTVGLTACVNAPAGPAAQPWVFTPTPGQGQYVRPEYMLPAPTPRIPAVDPCQSRMFAGLVGTHEGAIYIPGLPGTKRIIRPAFDEGFRDDFLGGENEIERLVEVRQYLPGQQLYAPSINDVTERISLGPDIGERLTIELDREGYIQEVRCG